MAHPCPGLGRLGWSHRQKFSSTQSKHWHIDVQTPKITKFYTFTLNVNQYPSTKRLVFTLNQQTQQILQLGACCMYLKSWGLSRFQSLGEEINLRSQLPNVLVALTNLEMAFCRGDVTGTRVPPYNFIAVQWYLYLQCNNIQQWIRKPSVQVDVYTV